MYVHVLGSCFAETEYEMGRHQGRREKALKLSEDGNQDRSLQAGESTSVALRLKVLRANDNRLRSFRRYFPLEKRRLRLHIRELGKC